MRNKAGAILVFFFLLLAVNSQLFADQGNLSHIRKAIHDKSLRWSAGDTSQSKLKPSERRRRLGSKLPLLTDIKRRTASSSISLPSKLDWRDYNGVNYVTPVKEQGVCGACWAFATTAALESNRLIFQNDQTNNLDLSEQTLISCGNAGNCDAGAIDAASDFVSNYGLPPETCYPYQAEDGSCANTCPNWEENAYRIPG